MTDVKEVKGVGIKTAEKLVKGGISTAEDLAKVTPEDVIALGIGKGTAAKIIANAQAIAGSKVEEAAPAEKKVEEKVEEKPKKKAEPKKKKAEPKKTEVEEKVEEKPEKKVEPKKTEVEEKPKKKAEPKKKKAEPKKKTTPKKKAEPKKKKRPSLEELLAEEEISRKKKGTQIKKVEAAPETIEEEELKTRSDWVVKTKELSEEELARKEERRKIRSAADTITREIPSPPQPVKAVKTGKKAKSEKPVKKEKKKKEVKILKKKKKEVIDYYSPLDLPSQTRTFKPRGVEGKAGSPQPRTVVSKGTPLGFISSHRRSRRNINHNTLIVQLNPEFDSETLLGKKVQFTYPDNGMTVVGSIYKRFGKRSSRKVLVRFSKGIRPVSRYQVVYAK